MNPLDRKHMYGSESTRLFLDPLTQRWTKERGEKNRDAITDIRTRGVEPRSASDMVRKCVLKMRGAGSVPYTISDSFDSATKLTRLAIFWTIPSKRSQQGVPEGQNVHTAVIFYMRWSKKLLLMYSPYSDTGSNPGLPATFQLRSYGTGLRYQWSRGILSVRFYFCELDSHASAAAM
jgi:hypothetical protein